MEIKPQVNDVWENKIGQKFKIDYVGKEFLVARNLLNDEEYIGLLDESDEMKLIERDGKLYKKERTGAELAGRLCEVHNKDSSFGVAIIRSYRKDMNFYFDLNGNCWDKAKEIPKEEILKLKNFEE